MQIVGHGNAGSLGHGMPYICCCRHDNRRLCSKPMCNAPDAELLVHDGLLRMMGNTLASSASPACRKQNREDQEKNRNSKRTTARTHIPASKEANMAASILASSWVQIGNTQQGIRGSPLGEPGESHADHALHLGNARVHNNQTQRVRKQANTTRAPIYTQT